MNVDCCSVNGFCSVDDFEGEGCYYLIGNNMLNNCCLMNVDICMLIY